MANQKKLLIIDDDPDYIAAIKAILERADYSVDVAHNPKTGFQLLQSKSFDLLLLDIMMGRGAEGVALARKIRKDSKLHEIPILIITGLREQVAFLFPGQHVHSNFIEMSDLVEKPIEPTLLLEKVNRLLKLSEDKIKV